jgi:DNA-binding CsgD family transcriptional regulator
LNSTWKPKSRNVDGRIKPEVRKVMPADELYDRHHQVVRMIVLGMKNTEIAESLNITPMSVSQIRTSPLIRMQIRKLHAEADEQTVDVRKEINAYAPKCLEIIQDILEDENVSANVRLSGAFKCLGLGGIVEPKNINVRALHGVVDANTLSMIKERAEILRSGGMLEE